MVPPACSTRALQMARPRPVPPVLRGARGVATVEAVEEVGGRMPGGISSPALWMMVRMVAAEKDTFTVTCSDSGLCWMALRMSSVKMVLGLLGGDGGRGLGGGQAEGDGDAAQAGDGAELADDFGEQVGDGGCGGGVRGGAALFDGGEQEHALDEVFHAFAVLLAALEAGLVLGAGALAHAEELDGGLDDGDGGFELVGGVAEEDTLLGEGDFEAADDVLRGR